MKNKQKKNQDNIHNADAKYNMGFGAFKNKDYSNAIKHWEELLEAKKYPDVDKLKRYLAKAYFYMGISLHSQQKHDDACESAKRATLLNPQVSDYHFYLGVLLHENGALDEAIESYNKGIELDPNNKMYNIHLAIAYIYMNEPEKLYDILQKIQSVRDDKLGDKLDDELDKKLENELYDLCFTIGNILENKLSQATSGLERLKKSTNDTISINSTWAMTLLDIEEGSYKKAYDHLGALCENLQGNGYACAKLYMAYTALLNKKKKTAMNLIKSICSGDIPQSKDISQSDGRPKSGKVPQLDKRLTTPVANIIDYFIEINCVNQVVDIFLKPMKNKSVDENMFKWCKEILIYAGNELLAKNSINKAIKLWEKGVKYGCTCQELLKNLALAYEEKGNIEKALDNWEYLIKRLDNDETLRSNKILKKEFAFMCIHAANLCGAIKDPEKLEHYFSLSLKYDPFNIDILLQQGELQLQMEEYSSAKKNFEKVLFKEPKNTKAMIGLGEVCFEQGDGDKAISLFEKAYAIAPNDPATVEKLAKIYEDRASYEWETNDMYAAEIWMQKVRKLKPQDGTVLVKLGIWHLVDGRHEIAEELFEDAITLCPEEVDIYINIGRTYLKLDYNQAATKYFKKLLELTSDNPFTYILIGEEYYEAGQKAQATRHFNKAIKVSNDDLDILLNVASIYQKNSDSKAAIKHLKKALNVAEEISADEKIIEIRRLLALIAVLSGDEKELLNVEEILGDAVGDFFDEFGYNHEDSDDADHDEDNYDNDDPDHDEVFEVMKKIADIHKKRKNSSKANSSSGVNSDSKAGIPDRSTYMNSLFDEEDDTR